MPAIIENTTLKKKLPTEATACYHCGEDCKEELIAFDEKAFCCEGCKMVYEILNTNDLCDFYTIEKNAGTSLKGQKTQRYAWLDDSEVVGQLIDYEDDKLMKVSFHVPQIHCASCLWLLENLYKLNPAVLASRVDFLKKEVYLTFDHQQTTLRSVVELLALIGYAPNIQLDKLNDDKKPLTDRKLIYQLGLAGFAFGNIMLLSFPEYFGLEELAFQSIFGYLNILIVLPVVIYSGQHYLRSAWFGLRQGDWNIDVPISLGILTLFGRSVFEILTQTGAGYLDSLAGLILFLLAGRWFQQKTYHHLSFERDYKSYFPVSATVLQGNETTTVALNKLEIGDKVLVRNQEIVPADGVLSAGRAQVDYSFVTGESVPVSKKIGDKIFAGGRQVGTGIEVVITKKVNQSYLVQLWNEDAFQKTEDTNASTLANKVGKYFTYAILLIAFGTLAYWLPRDMGLAINAFTAVLIIACPCAVALSIPFTLGNILRILAKHGLFLKNTQAIENLHEADAIVFDKTGTLTDTQDFVIDYLGISLTETETAWVGALAAQSTHPLSKAIATHFNIINKKEKTAAALAYFEEVEGKGLIGVFDGNTVKIGSADFVDVPSIRVKGGQVFIKINEDFKGYFSILPQYRKGLQSLMNYLKSFAEVHLISGDNDSEREVLEGIFEAEHLHFQQSPKEKLAYVQALQNSGKKVVMIGDGLNDAGALKQSNMGIVLAENTNNFTPACDAILDAQRFTDLPAFFDIAKGSVKLVYYAYAFAFVYNAIGLSFAVQGLLSPLVAAILMPLSSISIVIFGVTSSNLLGRKILRQRKLI